MNADINLLAEVPFFQLMDDAERKTLAEKIEVLRANANEHLFFYGDPGDALYVIRKGEAEVYIADDTGKRIVLEVVREGDFLGELSLLDGGPRTASVVVREELEALKIGRSDLQHLFQKHPEAALDLLAAMGRRLRVSANLLRHTTSRNVNRETEQRADLRHRLADWITEFSGSMKCLWFHTFFFAAWILINTGYVPFVEPFDPYPFGFLTTGVSLEAIYLTLVVLLSQNRQAAVDRIRADIEYDVNLKAELEISHLHEKLDYLHSRVLEQLAEIRENVGGRKTSELTKKVG